MLAAGIAVGALGDADQRHILDARLGERGMGRRQLRAARRRSAPDRAICSICRRRAFRSAFAHQAGEAAGQHFAHHGDSRRRA